MHALLSLFHAKTITRKSILITSMSEEGERKNILAFLVTFWFGS